MVSEESEKGEGVGRRGEEKKRTRAEPAESEKLEGKGCLCWRGEWKEIKKGK